MKVGRIKKDDTVVKRNGVDAGKHGRVLQVMPTSNRAVVEGVNMIKKTVRKSQDNPQGGIVEKEGSINLSNLMLYCPDCKKGVRIRRGKEADKRARKCAACGHNFDG